MTSHSGHVRILTYDGRHVGGQKYTRGPSLPKYVYEICKSIGFVDLIVGFVGVTVGFLVDLDLSVGFGGFSIGFGFGFGKRCTRFGGVSDPSEIHE